MKLATFPVSTGDGFWRPSRSLVVSGNKSPAAKEWQPRLGTAPTLETGLMYGIGRSWDRYQWVGDPANRAASGSDIRDDVEAWSLDQWVGEPRRGGPRKRWLAEKVDTSGGFSGFGQADGGGQRWATGYTPLLVAPVTDGSKIEPSRASS